MGKHSDNRGKLLRRKVIVCHCLESLFELRSYWACRFLATKELLLYNSFLVVIDTKQFTLLLEAEKYSGENTESVKPSPWRHRTVCGHLFEEAYFHLFSLSLSSVSHSPPLFLSLSVLSTSLSQFLTHFSLPPSLSPSRSVFHETGLRGQGSRVESDLRDRTEPSDGRVPSQNQNHSSSTGLGFEVSLESGSRTIWSAWFHFARVKPETEGITVACMRSCASTVSACSATLTIYYNTWLMSDGQGQIATPLHTCRVWSLLSID